jgi:hypothetical protein
MVNPVEANIICIEESFIYDEEVYDVIMEDPEYPMFFANNVLVHNSCYFKTPTTTTEEAIKLANETCLQVNQSFPTFMQETFNCDNNHDSMISAEQEIISDRGLFIKKKYYMLHLTATGGKLVDKMKYMGVPIKKTTMPKKIKDSLSSFIERLLKGEDWDIIGREIVYLKDNLMEIEDISCLGLPKGIKGLEKYTKLLNDEAEKRKEGTPIETPVRLPGHVAAAILWNKCLQSYKDKESPKITSGSKLSVFYLTKPVDRFTSIAIPKDVDILPEWFKEHFIPNIDRTAQITRLIDNPMEIMVSAAGLKVPTKKRLMFEEGLFL